MRTRCFTTWAMAAWLIPSAVVACDRAQRTTLASGASAAGAEDNARTLVITGAPQRCSPLAVSGAGPGAMVLFASPDQMYTRTAVTPAVIALAADPFPIGLKDPDEAPKVWIGVRLTPLPAPLAAHIGDKGLMVANIAKDSPADVAGLERYDVIVEFNGRAIGEQRDLMEAIEKAGAGRKAKLEIIRGGKHQTLAIEAADRPDPTTVTFKFDEPQDTVDQNVTLRGHALQLDPNGNWIWQDLGDLQNLPDMIKQRLPQFWTYDWNQANPPGIDFKFDFDPDDPDLAGKTWRYFLHRDDQKDDGAQTEVRVRVSDDGETVTIERRADGTFHVERKDRDGNESSADYDNLDALRKADPDAAAFYENQPGARAGLRWLSPRTPVMPQFQNDFRQRQQDYQQQIQELARQARERAEHAREQLKAAEQQARKAEEQAKKSLEQQKRERKGGKKPADDAAPKKPADEPSGDQPVVKVAPNGAVTVIVRKDGTKVTYEFESKEEFKSTEPKLYEQVKKQLK